MSQHFFYPPNEATLPGAVTANQGAPNTDANAWPVRITDGTHDATVTAGGALNVNIASGVANPLPVMDAAAEASLASIDGKTVHVDTGNVTVVSSALPTGAATSANQTTEITHLASIDTKLTNPIPVTISGGISNPLPVQDSAAEASLASIDSKLTNPLPISGTVTANAGTNLNTSALNLEATQLIFSNKSASAFINSPFDETVITYVGATTQIATVVYKLASVTVNTLTMTYDGSNRLIDVVKT